MYQGIYFFIIIFPVFSFSTYNNIQQNNLKFKEIKSFFLIACLLSARALAVVCGDDEVIGANERQGR